MAKINRIVDHYRFQKPQVINHEQYSNLKNVFTQNPSFKLNRFTPVYIEYKFLFIIGGVFIASLLVGAISDSSRVIPIFMISFIILLMQGINGSITSAVNYWKFFKIKTRFYEQLKLLILSSNNYNDFTAKYKNLQI